MPITAKMLLLSVLKLSECKDTKETEKKMVKIESTSE